MDTREKKIMEIIANNCPHWNECAYPCKGCPVYKRLIK